MTSPAPSSSGHAPPTAAEPFLSLAVLGPVWLCVVAAQATLMMPLLVGHLATRLGLTPAQTGLLASAAMVGASLAAGSQILLIRRLRWRSMAVVLLAVQALGYASLAADPGYTLALLAMAGLGMGFGGLLGLSQAAMAETAHQTRALGLTLALMGIVGSGMAAIVGALPSDAAWLTVLIGVCVLAVPSALWLRNPAPAGAPARQSNGGQIGRTRFLLAVFAYGLMNLANGGFWPLVERIAVAAHHSPALINQAVSLALLASTGGGIAALVLGPRAGLFLPIVFTGVATAACLVGIAAPLPPFVFSVSLVCFGFLWNFGPAYQLPAITTVDPEGRGMPAAVLAMKLFMAIGPFAYGLIAERAGYLIAGSVAAAASLGATLLLASLVAGRAAAPRPLSTVQDAPP